MVGGGSGRGKKTEGRFMGQAEPLKYKVCTGASVLPHLRSSPSLVFFSCSVGVRVTRVCEL